MIVIKITCSHCGIVNKPHRCPYKPKRKVDYTRADRQVYKTARWQDIRTGVLLDYNFVCLWSLYVNGEIVEADVVHHIVEIMEDPSKAYDYDNLVPLEYCNHQHIHELYKQSKGKVQELLRKMICDYAKGDRTLGKYKNSIPRGCGNF